VGVVEEDLVGASVIVKLEEDSSGGIVRGDSLIQMLGVCS
jgi:hypothetical protein